MSRHSKSEDIRKLRKLDQRIACLLAPVALMLLSACEPAGPSAGEIFQASDDAALNRPAGAILLAFCLSTPSA
jgi:hypothetical protein